MLKPSPSTRHRMLEVTRTVETTQARKMGIRVEKPIRARRQGIPGQKTGIRAPKRGTLERKRGTLERKQGTLERKRITLERKLVTLDRTLDTLGLDLPLRGNQGLCKYFKMVITNLTLFDGGPEVAGRPYALT